jgi:hypothetical protein
VALSLLHKWVYQRIAECKEAAATAAHNGGVCVAQKMQCALGTKKNRSAHRTHPRRTGGKKAAKP